MVGHDKYSRESSTCPAILNCFVEVPNLDIMGAATKQDEELNLLLTKLYAIQEAVGASEKTSDEEKRLRAQQAGALASSTIMGSTKKSKKKGSRFLELKSSIVDAL